MIYNLTKKTVLSKQTFVAVSFRDRLQGMIGRKFNSFDAIVFFRCSAIHTFFMSGPIDVIFLSTDNDVLKTEQKCRPWRAVVSCPNACTVIELPPGTLNLASTAQGDRLDLNAEITKETQQSLLSNIISRESGSAIPCNRENSTR